MRTIAACLLLVIVIFGCERTEGIEPEIIEDFFARNPKAFPEFESTSLLKFEPANIDPLLLYASWAELRDNLFEYRRERFKKRDDAEKSSLLMRLAKQPSLLGSTHYRVVIICNDAEEKRALISHAGLPLQCVHVKADLRTIVEIGKMSFLLTSMKKEFVDRGQPNLPRAAAAISQLIARDGSVASKMGLVESDRVVRDTFVTVVTSWKRGKPTSKAECFARIRYNITFERPKPSTIELAASFQLGSRYKASNDRTIRVFHDFDSTDSFNAPLFAAAQPFQLEVDGTTVRVVSSPGSGGRTYALEGTRLEKATEVSPLYRRQVELMNEFVGTFCNEASPGP